MANLAITTTDFFNFFWLFKMDIFRNASRSFIYMSLNNAVKIRKDRRYCIAISFPDCKYIVLQDISSKLSYITGYFYLKSNFEESVGEHKVSIPAGQGVQMTTTFVIKQTLQRQKLELSPLHAVHECTCHS